MNGANVIALRPAELKDAATASARLRRPDADGLCLVSRAASARAALRREPARHGAVRDLALRRQRAGSEPRRCLAAVELVRARDHRPVRAAISRSAAAASAGTARGRGDRHAAVRSGLSAGSSAQCGRQPNRSFRNLPAPKPTCSCCRSARCAPTWSSSAEFLFFYVGEAILHYHPRLFFKHRGMEKRFEGLAPAGGVVLAERVSGVGSVAHALAYCQAVEAASNCIVPPRARFLARAAGGNGAALQSPALFRPPLSHHDAQSRRGGRQAARRARQATQYPADRQPVSAQRYRRLAGCGAIWRRKPWLGAELEELARRIARYADAHGKHRESSRPPDHDRTARSPRSVRSGRHRTGGARVGHRPRPAARPSLCRLCGASARGARRARPATRMRARRCVWRRWMPASP